MSKIEDRFSLFKKLLSYIVVFIIVFFINSFIFFLGYIPSESMEPTLHTGDFIFGTRYDVENIERYDIVVFKYPDDETIHFVKRVIGMPGDHIEIINGTVYVDEKKIEDTFVKELSNDTATYDVPENCYFMLGDNRNNSLDSRYWENTYVREDQIVAIVKCKFFPFPKIIK